MQDDALFSDEEELQQFLGKGMCKWEFIPKRSVRIHRATVSKLLGGKDNDTVIVCRCGWAMRFGKTVLFTEAEAIFLEHPDG